MHGDFQLAHCGCHFWHAKMSRQGSAAISEQVTKTLPVGDQLDQTVRHIHVAKTDFQAAGIFWRDQAFLKQVTCQGNGGAGADSVQAVQVAEVAGIDHTFQVVDQGQ